MFRSGIYHGGSPNKKSFSSAGGLSVDELAKVTAADTTANYLNSKIVGGTNITTAILNAGANELLQLNANFAGLTGIDSFRAIDTASIVVPPTVRTTVPFNTEIYDDNNNYNPVTGVYTAPANGLYHFSCSLGLNISSTGFGYAEIWFNNTTDILSFSGSRCGIAGLIAPACSVWKRLQQNDTVRVKAYQTTGFAASTNTAYSYTHFSGAYFIGA